MHSFGCRGQTHFAVCMKQVQTKICFAVFLVEVVFPEASGWDLPVKWVGVDQQRRRKKEKPTLRALRTGRAFHSSKLGGVAHSAKDNQRCLSFHAQ